MIDAWFSENCGIDWEVFRWFSRVGPGMGGTARIGAGFSDENVFCREPKSGWYFVLSNEYEDSSTSSIPLFSKSECS